MIVCAIACAPGVDAAPSRSVAFGVSTTGAPPDVSRLDAFSTLVGRRPRIVMWFQDWHEGGAPLNAYFGHAVRARGGTPMVTWSPWGGKPRDPAYSLARINAGAFDPYIRAAAREAASYRKPLFLRFAHEMNGTWYPWGRGINGNTPDAYRAAWRHVVSIFRRQRAHNVCWIWAPNVSDFAAPFESSYPGDRWVDWVGLDGYNFGTRKASGWRSLGQVFGASYRQITRLTRKPLMLAEVGSAEQGGSKATWLLDGLLGTVPDRFPRARAVVWFDRNKEADWRLGSSLTSLSATRLILTSSVFGGPARLRNTAPRANAPTDRLDCVGPSLTRLRATRPRAGSRRGTVRYRLSRRATVKLSFRRLGRRRLIVVRVRHRTGGRKLVRPRLPSGRWRLRAVATDVNGRPSRPRVVRLRG